MQRPLSSSEVGWLVRLLVLLSGMINAKLRLDEPLPPADQRAQPESDFQVQFLQPEVSETAVRLKRTPYE